MNKPHLTHCRATWLRSLCSLACGLWLSACQAMEPEAIERHLERLIRASLTPQQSRLLQLHMRTTAPRGAATQPCDQGLQFDSIDISQWRRVHVPVLCGSERGSWVVLVKAQAPVWQANRNLNKGSVLQASDLQQESAQVYSPADLIEQSDWVQMQLKSSLKQGATLRMQHLELPIYAKKGEVIEIHANSGAVSVSAQGVATRNARKGEHIRVRNLRSQQWVSGTLVAPRVMEADQASAGGVKVVPESLD